MRIKFQSPAQFQALVDDYLLLAHMDSIAPSMTVLLDFLQIDFKELQRLKHVDEYEIYVVYLLGAMERHLEQRLITDPENVEEIMAELVEYFGYEPLSPSERELIARCEK